MSRILVHLEHKTNQGLLAKWLAKEHDILLLDAEDKLGGALSGPESGFDLGILDGPALTRHAPEVRLAKKTESQLFLPFLMVSVRADIGLVTKHLWREIDELIFTPIEKAELLARVSIMLRARDYTKALAAERNRARAYFDVAAVIMIVIGGDEKITHINQKGCEVLEASSGEIIGKSWFDLFVPPDASEARRLFRQMISGGNAGQAYVELPIVTKRGKTRQIAWRNAVLREPSEMVTTILASGEDITENRLAEEAKKQLEQERARRHAYADAFRAVTDDRLLLLTPDEIEDRLGAPIGPRISLASFEELARVRHDLREIVGRELPLAFEMDQVILAAGEAITNAVKHGGPAEVQVFNRKDTAQICISDAGPGIDFTILPRAALTPGFSTKISLGMGFTFMLELADKVLLTTQPGNTTVVLEFNGLERAAA